jgi:hypothetical protein
MADSGEIERISIDVGSAMKDNELRAAIESWLKRGELRPTTFADAYRVRPARVVEAMEQMIAGRAARIAGEYQVFASRGISTWPIYAPIGERVERGERLAA